jgi:membrane protease YdiL (CAAX protease family)
MRFGYWRTRAAGVPVVLGAAWSPALVWGIGGGIAALFAGMAYTALTASMGLLPAGQAALADRAWFATLAVVAAPVFEEFIFRGLIFGGLRRSLGRRWRAPPSSPSCTRRCRSSRFS